MDITIGYSSFQNYLEKNEFRSRNQISSPVPITRARVSSKTLKRKSIRKAISDIIPVFKKKKPEFEYLSKQETIADKMQKIKAEREDIQRRLKFLEKRCDQRRFYRESQNFEKMVPDSNIRIALKQKQLIEKRLARRNEKKIFKRLTLTPL